MRLLTGFIFVILALPACGELLDPASAANSFLDQLTPLLHRHGIDTARNLNASACKPGKKPRNPRLGALADIPPGAMANSSELLQWESSYLAQEIGAITALPATHDGEVEATYLEKWLTRRPEQRIFITYAATDRAAADILLLLLEQLGYATADYPGTPENATTGDAPRLYASSGHRLVLDSRQGRKAGSAALEMELTGKKLYRRSESVFPPSGRSARYYIAGEPDRFRKADLGDENVAATIPEIIVSGGIALGERATFQTTPMALEFMPDKGFLLEFRDGATWRFPQTDTMMLKACFDFALRSLNIESDAIIDIDERQRIKISGAFKNTEIGYQLIEIDEQPFEYVKNLKAIKSVIIDTSVSLHARDSLGGFSTTYEIRFINPDRRKLAETRVALMYSYDSFTDTASYRDSWGPRAFRVTNVAFADLGEATRKAAIVAGWAALFRTVENSDIDFSRGRYEFLKIDNSGRPTPRSSPGG